MTNPISTRPRFGNVATTSTAAEARGRNVVHAKPVPCPGGGKLQAIKPGVLVDFDTGHYGPWHGIVQKVVGPLAYIVPSGAEQAGTTWTKPIMELKVREQ